MYDKELIERICNLTCSKEDLLENQTSSINYDSEYPFRKYYDVNIIIKAINKYISKEWDDQILARWCNKYNWILCGGFSNDVKEDLNPLEQYLFDDLSWGLDGLSFFDEETYFEESKDEIYGIIESFKKWDHIWQTRDSWKGVYAPIGVFNLTNGDQYVLLVNETLKEYVILFSAGHLSNNYKHQNDYLRYTSRNKFAKMVEKLKDEYKIISRSEKFYYSDLYDLDE